MSIGALTTRAAVSTATANRRSGVSLGIGGAFVLRTVSAPGVRGNGLFAADVLVLKCFFYVNDIGVLETHISRCPGSAGAEPAVPKAPTEAAAAAAPPPGAARPESHPHDEPDLRTSRSEGAPCYP
jgi:hypothetical protein